jgi:hypothetical protein
MVRGKVLAEKAIGYTACRVGKGPHPRDPATRDLPHHKPYLCRGSSMFVIFSRSLIPSVVCADFLSGRDYDYQTLNLSFAVNVMKFGIIIGLFPKPLKPCVLTSTHVPLFTEHALVSFHACYRISLPRFSNRLNSSDLWLRSDLRRWRNMGMTGMISRFVRQLFLVSLSLYG